MRREGGDSTALFALLVATPLLLPALGVELTDLAFLLPVATLIYATVCCARASSRATARRSLWIALGLVSAITVLAALSGVVAQLMGADPVVAFYLGSLGSVGLLAGACLLAVRSLSDATFDGLSEGLICGVVVACVSVYFVVAPGVSEGDVLLTGVFVLDVAALLVAGMVSVAGPTREQRRIGRWLALGISTAVIGDALVALAAAGLAAEMPTVTAILWALAGAGLAAAAQAEGSQALSDETELSENWITNRLLLPIVAVASLPTIVLCVWLAGSLTGWTVAFFGIFFAVVITLVFGRQAYLLVDNRRAIARERTAAPRDGPPQRRPPGAHRPGHHDDPDARGGADRGARARRAAPRRPRHQWRAPPGGPERAGPARGVTGAWNEEHTWARRGIEDTGVGVRTRGGRHIFTLPLHARGKAIGTVTLHARRRRRLRRRGARPPEPAGQPARDRRPERARLPREARAGDPRPAHRRLQPPLLLRGARQGGQPHRALRLAVLARDLRHRRLQERSTTTSATRSATTCCARSRRSPPG